jgi:hypothetical protein
VFLVVRTVRLLRPDVPSPCPDRRILYDLLHGTTFGRHLSFVQTVNPVGLYRIPPRYSPSHFIIFGVFVVLYVFLCFLCVLLTCACPFCNLSPPQERLSTFLLIYFKFLCLK